MKSTGTTEWWQQEGYLAGRPLDDHYWLCLTRMIFTWRVMLCDKGGVYDFCCFAQLADARACYDAWDGKGLPPGEWIRHHQSGLRHENGVLVNEYGQPVEP